MKKIGMLTVGQSPRNDVMPDLISIKKLGITIVECGALDGFSYHEVIEKFSPVSNSQILVTRMADGKQVTIGKEKILYLIQKCITLLESENCEVIVLLCTGDFPAFEHNIPLVKPCTLLRSVTNELVANGPIGVIVPDQEQIEYIKQRWSHKNIQTVFTAVSPYTDSKLEEAALELVAADAKIIFLDGIGYSLEAKEIVRQITGLPVLSPRTMVIRILEEME